MSEHIAVILDANGNVENIIVVPATDEELGAAWKAQQGAPKLRRLSPSDVKKGVGLGWKFANNQWTDERPVPPVEPAQPTKTSNTSPSTPASN